MKLLGEILIADGLLSKEELKAALKTQRESGERLGKILVKQGLLTEKDLVRALSEQLKIPIANFDIVTGDNAPCKQLPVSLATKYQAFPLRKWDHTLELALSDPLNILAIDEMSEATGLNIETAIAGEQEIAAYIEKYYGFKELETEFTYETAKESVSAEKFWEIAESSVDENQLIRLVNTIIRQGISLGASDIHIEPHIKKMRIRYRVDGILRDVMELGLEYLPPLISRIKIMAGMDIAEKRQPQDGRMSLKIKDRVVNLRLSVSPTVLGEKLVARILERLESLITLDNLGFSLRALEQYKQLLKNTDGLILAAGPTGSGKSATLYSSLYYLNSSDLNITTIEDPVEYVLTGVNQINISSKPELGFATGLRSILRQDPDVIMVGEIRDQETAEIAIRAAITGHLVFSTLHTADAPGAITRLMDMGIEPYLVASAAKAVVAQRLVRRVCPHCKEIYSLEQFSDEAIFIEEMGYPLGQAVRGKGCGYCDYTGYKGRIAILEILSVDNSIRQGIMQRMSRNELKTIALANGMLTLQEDGIEKAFMGLTTIKEVMRVAYNNEI